MIRAVVVATVVASAFAAPSANAEVVALPRTKAALMVPDGWTKVTAPGVVAGFKGPDGTLLAVTRARVPNPDAWRPKTRDAYIESIERGVAGSIRGYRRLAKQLATVSGVPAFDLEARRDDGATLIFRFLLFRTYALALAIEVPRGGAITDARKLAMAFAPSVKHTSDTP